MKWFCPFCWAEIQKNTKICPKCNKNLQEFQKLSFEDKLILGLKNPVTQNRKFVIHVLGNIKSYKAVKILGKMLLENRDTFELCEIARTLKKINTPEAINYLKAASNTKNLILRKVILNLLKET